MAEDGVRPTRQNRRHPAPFLAYVGAAHRIDPIPEAVEAARRQPVCNGVSREAGTKQLLTRKNVVLVAGQSPQPGAPVNDLSGHHR
jgi:hypothetical protein